MRHLKSELPTCPDLLTGILVDFTSKHKGVATNTLKIAEALDIRHSDVKAIVRRLAQKGLIDVRRRSHIYLDSLNRKQSYFELGEEEALQVVMSMKGYKAERLHKEVAQAFISMKEELIDWQTGRLQVSESTKVANDSVFWLKTELEKVIPESNRCKMLFIHIQQGINKAVTDHARIERSLLDREQLDAINALESHVRNSIEAFKTKGMPAEQIREEIMALIKSGGSYEARKNLPRRQSEAGFQCVA